MAAISVNNDFSTPIFTIIAGSNQKHFYAHADVLSKAEKFRAIVNGDWQETRDRIINLAEWDEDTVTRLLEFLYTDDYPSPFPSPLARSPSTDVHKASIKPNDNADSSRYELRSKTKNEATTTADSAAKPRPNTLSLPQARRNALLSGTRSYLKSTLSHPSAHHDAFVKRTYAIGFNPQRQDFYPPLISHAAVYALADAIILPSLQQLALFRLADLLNLGTDLGKPFGLDRSVATVEVTKFIYANTGARMGGEMARVVVSEFLALKLDLLEESVVEGLMEEGGEVVVDVMGFLRSALKGDLF